MRSYGKGPVLLGQYEIKCNEFMCYVSLPVKMPQKFGIFLPENLEFIRPVICDVSVCHQSTSIDWRKTYIYLTVKSLWVTPESPGNRPGWHVDGYGSDGDLNFIWCDKNPTEFAIQDDLNIPDDDVGSMIAMSKQVRPESIVTYPVRTLIMLDEDVVHRVGPVVETGRRTFVKITLSEHKFNLEGNSHNYLFDYDWSMQPRSNGRNIDCKKAI